MGLLGAPEAVTVFDFGFQNVNYLDDLGGAKREDRADESFAWLERILNTIGIQEARKKARPPATIAVFLGILFNTISMTLQITTDRLEEIKRILSEWMMKQFMTSTELQSLLGKLNFASNTVHSGRVFVSRLINELRNFSQNRKKVSVQMRKDIEWWFLFMEHFDGITIMPPVAWDAPDMVFSTDATLNSCGGWTYHGNGRAEAFQKKFQDWLKNTKNVFINEL